MLATKVVAMPARKGLKAGTPIQETIGAFDALVAEGKVLQYGLSNYEPDRLREALAIAPDVVALQPKYSLVEREDYEAERLAIAQEHDLAVVPYYALASGFLSGKYRPGSDPGDSPRASGAREYLESDRGPRVLDALDEIADATGGTVPSVALAWLAAQPTVLAPIASARTTDQLANLLAPVSLSEDQLARLTAASA